LPQHSWQHHREFGCHRSAADLGEHWVSHKNRRKTNS
jgi:hypothetical protein